MALRTMDELNLPQKTVLLRLDLNVPMHHGVITNDNRILKALPTIEQVLRAGAGVIIVSHLGRPKVGDTSGEFSLSVVQQRLAELLNKPVQLIQDWPDKSFTVNPGEVVLLENIRLQAGEKENDPALAKKLGTLADVFIMDAFACAHRAHASVVGVADFVNESAVGPLVAAEVRALEQALNHPKKPVLAILGGAKVSTKLAVIEQVMPKVDYLILGGGMANTFLAAQGLPVGDSLYEASFIDQAQKILQQSSKLGCTLLLPTDAVVASDISEHAQTKVVNINQVASSDKILDIGPATIQAYQQVIAKVHTIIWNGPVGVFECKPFAQGTKALAQAIASAHAYTLAGGGDTVSAIDAFISQVSIDYVSTAGGAFLEWFEGKALPGLERFKGRC